MYLISFFSLLRWHKENHNHLQNICSKCLHACIWWMHFCSIYQSSWHGSMICPHPWWVKLSFAFWCLMLYWDCVCVCVCKGWQATTDLFLVYRMPSVLRNACCCSLNWHLWFSFLLELSFSFEQTLALSSRLSNLCFRRQNAHSIAQSDYSVGHSAFRATITFVYKISLFCPQGEMWIQPFVLKMESHFSALHESSHVFLCTEECVLFRCIADFIVFFLWKK